jgi:hypothetical protein
MYKSQVRRSIVAIHSFRLFSFTPTFQHFPHASGWIAVQLRDFMASLRLAFTLYHPMEPLHDAVRPPFSSVDPAHSDAFTLGVFIDNSVLILCVRVLFYSLEWCFAYLMAPSPKRFCLKLILVTGCAAVPENGCYRFLGSIHPPKFKTV